ncbi:MAG TPA: flavin reductase family protein [Candidatus Limnocylindria bacterium]|nr:flavin reductase family protein [Candidatus Limnocylindria bacterium]
MTDSTRVAAQPALDPQQYREALGRFVTGVTVVTTLEQTQAGAQPWGTTVNSFTGVSLDPPLVLVSIGRNRAIHPIIGRTGRFGVNVLGEGSQVLSDCFAGAPSAMPKDAFCGARWEASEAGLPLLEQAIAFVGCAVERTIEAGDHTLYIARVLETAVRDEPGWPLLYFRRRYLRIERGAMAELRGKADG